MRTAQTFFINEWIFTMKDNIKKVTIYFLFFLLPISWLIGFTYAMVSLYKLQDTHFLLSLFLRITPIFIGTYIGRDMWEKGLRGVYSIIILVASIGVVGLSMWLHYTFL